MTEMSLNLLIFQIPDVVFNVIFERIVISLGNVY